MSSYFISVNLVPRPPPDFILLAAVEKKLGEGLGSLLVTDRKWWTRLVHNVDSVHTNRVHHFRPMTYQ